MSIKDRVLWLLLGISVVGCAVAILTSSPVAFVVALPSAALVSIVQAKRG